METIQVLNPDGLVHRTLRSECEFTVNGSTNCVTGYTNVGDNELFHALIKSVFPGSQVNIHNATNLSSFWYKRSHVIFKLNVSYCAMFMYYTIKVCVGVNCVQRSPEPWLHVNIIFKWNDIPQKWMKSAEFWDFDAET